MRTHLTALLILLPGYNHRSAGLADFVLHRCYLLDLGHADNVVPLGVGLREHPADLLAAQELRKEVYLQSCWIQGKIRIRKAQ